MKLKLPFFGPLIALAIFSLPVVAHAENFQGLSGQGYKVAALSNNKAGVKGWTLSKGPVRYFCELRASLAYSGKNGMVSFTSAGRVMTLDRAAFEKRMGGPDKSLPQYEDLKAGRPRPVDVGSCRKLR
ncbi:hypothetical protein [Agrobacterium tumefaciens]|uniref:hypothetical protein n=1 Tax=Agrobacterium tumefaciens TaxID=358 RepID=UPI0021D1D114|nr:hypothetical protein [Agrobacterium tumefaciens]UXS02059.1 hypothetical protein FY156_11605 [Agrobacterium tumefaciens]